MLFPIFVRQGRSRTRFKVGYINHSGNVVIEPLFDEGTNFYEGLASVKIRNRWGVINSDGEFVIQPAARSWCRFRDGLASVSVKGLWGVIDETSNFVVEPRYDYIGSYHDGLAKFVVRGQSERKRCGFLDKKGTEVIPANFANAKDFSGGLAAVRVGNLWGYINPSGAFVIKPRFEALRHGKHGEEKTEAGYFVDGLAPIWLKNGYGFIDRAGEPVFEHLFDEAGSFHDGRALVKRGRYGFVDVAGTIAIETRFTRASDFSEGLSPVAEEEWALGFIPPCGFVDLDGEMALQPAFYSAQGFRDGLSLVTTENSIGYINRSGEFVWQGPYVEYGVVL